MWRLLATTSLLTGLLVSGARADPGPETLPQAPMEKPPAAPAPKPVRVLATGDSMAISLADGLTEQLERTPEASVEMDAQSGSGISKSYLFSWPAYALDQIRRYRPAATVVFLGASEGYPLRSRSGRAAQCCRAPWRREYARRVRQMMGTYSRGGEAYVYWLLLPYPRPSSTGRRRLLRRRAFVGVNAGIQLAASTMTDTVRLVRLNEVFTPSGRYGDSIVWAGRRVTVRAADGIHLSRQGASIAASLVVDRMRSDGLLLGGWAPAR